MINIAYIYGVESDARRRGIFDRATELEARILSFQLEALGIGIPEVIAMARPDACIIESNCISAGHLSPEDINVPVVVCDVQKQQLQDGFTGIQYDRETATLRAMEALFELKLPNYAFVGYHHPYEWSRLREEVFTETITGRGLPALVLSFPHRKKLPEYMTTLEKWMLTLPRPCGLLAVNDEIGDYVLTCASRLGIRVPDELAVIGVDNDVARCENIQPPLASVPPDNTRSGRLAVDMVMEMLRTPSRLPKPVTYGAGAVVPRGSLRRFHRQDSAAAKAMDFIRVHATESDMSLDAVARAMKLPLSTARIRFQKYAGHSIFAEIENQRFLLACSLLQDREQKIGSIHEACGYGCTKSLCNVFLKRTGLTPSEWRARHA